MSGTYFLTLEEAKKRFQNAEGMDPSTARAKIADAFNVANKV